MEGGCVHVEERAILIEVNYFFAFAIVSNFTLGELHNTLFLVHLIIVGVDMWIRYLQTNHVGTYELVCKGYHMWANFLMHAQDVCFERRHDSSRSVSLSHSCTWPHFTHKSRVATMKIQRPLKFIQVHIAGNRNTSSQWIGHRSKCKVTMHHVEGSQYISRIIQNNMYSWTPP